MMLMKQDVGKDEEGRETQGYQQEPAQRACSGSDALLALAARAVVKT